jgi:hypothetical protein
MPFSIASFPMKRCFERKPMGHHIKFAGALVALLVLASLASSDSPAGHQSMSNSQNQTQAKGKVVYVCACLKTKSCFCMTEAKMEGPCACGTEGGPPMKAVPPDGGWAKANREALAQ